MRVREREWEAREGGMAREDGVTQTKKDTEGGRKHTELTQRNTRTHTE